MSQSPRRSDSRTRSAAVRPAPRAPKKVLCAYESDADRECPVPAVLRELGQEASQPAPLDDEFVRIAVAEKPDLAVVRSDHPGAAGASVVRALWEQAFTPTLVVTSCDDPEALMPLLETGAVGFMSPDASVTEARCQTFALWRHGQALREKTERVNQLERNLANRRTVEQAKWKLVQERGMSEPDAHTRLQTAARNSRLPLADIAQAVVDGTPLPRGVEI